MITSDLGLTAALLTVGHKFIKIEKEGSRCIFHFEDSKKIEKDEMKYANGILKVNARTYFDSIRIIKTKIHGY